jgi:hypothetical protein
MHAAKPNKHGRQMAPHKKLIIAGTMSVSLDAPTLTHIAEMGAALGITRHAMLRLIVAAGMAAIDAGGAT